MAAIVIFFAKYAKSRSMETGRPDDGPVRKVVCAGQGPERLGVRGLEDAHHPPAVRRQIAAHGPYAIQLEAFRPCGHRRHVGRVQWFGKLALEDDVLHVAIVPPTSQIGSGKPD
jgi:hypothetical protein